MGVLGYLLLILGILYFILPYDMLPDFIPGVGRIDDLILAAYLYWVYQKKYKRPSGSGPGTSAGGNRRSEGNSSGHSADFGEPAGRSRDPFEILGTSRHASIEEIKHAYRVQASRYHPDKVSHLGEEFQLLAKQKFQEIQWAYEQVMRGRV